MANGINNADKLLARILDDARGEAAKIEAAASAQAEEIRARAEREAAALAAETESRAKAAHAEAIEHAETAAQLEARKQALASRRMVLDEAFAAALKELCAMTGEARAALLSSIAAEEADGGETLRPAKADEAGIEAVLQKVNATLAQNGRAALALGPVDETFPTTINNYRCAIIRVLFGGGYEKDCSFEAMLREARDRLEGGVAKRLFG